VIRDKSNFLNSDGVHSVPVINLVQLIQFTVMNLVEDWQGDDTIGRCGVHCQPVTDRNDRRRYTGLNSLQKTGKEMTS